jgi:uncharacterized protein (TIGR02996 family)
MSVSSREACEAALLDNPDDAAMWAVYADLLQDAGDPRGELVVLGRAMDATPDDDERVDRFAQHLYDHRGVFIGDLERWWKTFDGLAEDAFAWRSGFIDEVKLFCDEDVSAPDFDTAIREICGHASGRFLRSLRISIVGRASSGYRSVLEALEEIRPPALRHLLIGHPFSDSDAVVGDLGGVLAACPRLSLLGVEGAGIDVSRASPSLGSLELSLDDGELLGRVASLDWPTLVRLRLHSNGQPLPQRILDGTSMPKLTYLSILNPRNADVVVEQLALAPVLAKVGYLALSNITDAGVAVMVRYRDRFAHLESIAVLVAEVDVGPLRQAGLKIETP